MKLKTGLISFCLEATRTRLYTILFTLSSILYPLSSLADADWGFYYQAEIPDASGHNYTVTIKLYSTASSTEVRWGRKYDVYCDNNGLFSVFLTDAAGTSVAKSTDSLKTVIQNHSPGGLYIGLTIGSGSEIKPRQQVCAMPYANASQALAKDATALGNLTVDGDCAVSNSVCAGSVEINDVAPVSVPVGGIILWSRSDIAPDGQPWNGNVSQDNTWRICDGAGSITPNLQTRFLVGVGKLDGTGTDYTYEQTGGKEKVKLELSQIASHSHHFKFDMSWTMVTLDLGDNVWIGVPHIWQTSHLTDHPPADKSDIISILNKTTDSAGSSSEHENRPQYCALYYVMRVQ